MSSKRFLIVYYDIGGGIPPRNIASCSIITLSICESGSLGSEGNPFELPLSVYGAIIYVPANSKSYVRPSLELKIT
jgi:hypothetical protein